MKTAFKAEREILLISENRGFCSETLESNCHLTSRHLSCRHLWHRCCHVNCTLWKRGNNILPGWFALMLRWGCTSVISTYFPLFLLQLHSLHSSGCDSLWLQRGGRRGQDTPPDSFCKLALKLMLRCHLDMRNLLHRDKRCWLWIWIVPHSRHHRLLTFIRGASRPFSCCGKLVVQSYDKDEENSLRISGGWTRSRSQDTKSSRLQETWFLTFKNTNVRWFVPLSGKTSMETVWKWAGTFKEYFAGDRMNHLSITGWLQPIRLTNHMTVVGERHSCRSQSQEEGKHCFNGERPSVLFFALLSMKIWLLLQQ